MGAICVRLLNGSGRRSREGTFVTKPNPDTARQLFAALGVWQADEPGRVCTRIAAFRRLFRLESTKSVVVRIREKS